LQGILVDQWRAWEKRTGIAVDIRGMDWGEALRRMRAGEFDVIDTIFETAERRAYFEFSPAYASIEVPIFFRTDMSGITDLESLKGFPVAAKAGDNAAGGEAAVDYLHMAQQMGAAKVLAKPFPTEVLMAGVDELLPGGGAPGQPPAPE
jgi:ABC-type amino acid transport substrate-binding protein